LPEPVDWDALAAQVLGNLAATGQWFLGDDGRKIALVSTDAQGRQLNVGSFDPLVSEDGRYVTFIAYGEFQFYRKDVRTGELMLVSANADGIAGNAPSGLPVIYDMTSDGRHVAFGSSASNLVPGDTNGQSDVFVKDMQTGAVTLVSTDEQGRQGDSASTGASVSEDGRTVAFLSIARNFMPESAGSPGEPTTVTPDIYVKDLETGRLVLASADAEGHQGTGPVSAYYGASSSPSLSADGQKVAFVSYATNLVPDDTNGQPDVFLKDLRTGEVTLVSTDGAGHQANGGSGTAAISATGRYVAFDGFSSNLVPGDNNGASDVFMKDLQTGEVTLVSSTLEGRAGSGHSAFPAISGNGRYVSFHSSASDLVAGDANGTSDVFLKDLSTGEVRLVSEAIGGGSGNFNSEGSDVTDEGDVAFASRASNLVPNDTNGLFDIFLWA
jgi:Tol biopolymer transport system component